ncbi:D-alanyl-D-alanine carboxypeptidase [Streptomyces sp. NPDC001858]
MAGESPDRSKQRESSTEPTSGSAGTVPEARGSRDSGGAVRDPRIAVAREAESSASRGGVDTATRVFSVRDLKTEDDEDGERAEEPTGAEAEAEDAETEASAPAAEADEDDKDGEGAEEPTEAAAEPEDGPESAEGASGDAGDGDERLRAVVAQWVVSADEKSSADEDDSADDEAEDTDGDADTDVDAEAETDVEERSESVAEEADEDDPADDSADDTAPEAEAKPVSKPAPKWASDADETEAETEAPDDSPVDQPTAVFKAPRPKPAVDQPTTMLKLGDAAKPKPEPTKDEPKAEPKAEAKAKAEAEAAPKTEPKAVPKAEPKAEAAPAERASRFVALKPLDEPRPLKQDVTALVPQIGPERTTQQPLPPKPPLDLLAELTNTPPPPPTPMRTLGRRIKIWTPLLILLLVVFAIAQAVRPLPATALTLTAKDAYTFDGGKTQLPWPGEGQGWMDIDGVGTMGSFGEQTPVAIGSVAKTMTAYIILKDHPMKAGEEGPEIEVDATAEKEGGYDVTGDESTLNTVKAGDKLTEKQALSAVLIPSANNIARLLARWDAGSEAAFVKKMNATAKELGMTNTTYTDPSGLKETTVSTAEDQVKLGRAFVQVPALVSISSAASWTDPSGKYWNNYNELPYRIGAIGIKTGSTTAAGGNLLFASRKEVDGRSVTIVGAILGQHKQKILETVNTVSKTALLAAQEALTSAKIVKKGDVVGYVDDKMGHHTPVVVTKDVPVVGWAGLTVKLSFTAGEVPHTAKAGTQVGTLTVGDGSSSAVKVPVALQADLVEPGFTDKLTRIG